MDGSKPSWKISESADPRFFAVKLPHMLPADLRDVSQKDRDEAFRRLSILKRWEEFLTEQLRQNITRTDATNAFLTNNPDLNVSRATLYIWDKRYRSEGLRGLLPKYIAKETTISEEAIAAFRSLFLTTNKLSVKTCWRMVQTLSAQNGWNWFGTARSCQRWVAITFTKAELTLNREGEESYNEICAPYLQRDPEQWSGNECLVGDHHQLDLWCRYQGRLIRPWMTAWEDMRSKMITGWVLCESPNSSTILLAFRRSCKSEFGPPAHAYMDNGKDYDSFVLQGRTKPQRHKAIRKGDLNEGQIQGLFGQMGITVTFAIPYNPQSKPIERFFRTMEDQFCKTFASYCGNKPENRPEDLQRILDANGDGIPTFEEIEKKLTTWVNEVYHVSEHNGNGMEGRSPMQVMRETQSVKRLADDRILDLLLMAWSKPIGVGKHGLRFNNINFGMGQPEMIALQGREVRIAYDPADIAEVTVWGMDGKFLCRAKANSIVQGMTDEHLRKGMAMKRHIKKALRQADDVRHLAHKDVSELALKAAADAARESAGEIPDPNIERYSPIRSDLDAALLNIAKPLKKAAGDDSEPISFIQSDLMENQDGPDSSDIDSDISDGLLSFSRGLDEKK
jgi:hypothetical protein